jgi:hypothetical protein
MTDGKATALILARKPTIQPTTISHRSALSLSNRKIVADFALVS